MEELANNGVNIYRFPVDDETVAEMNAGMNVSTDCFVVWWLVFFRRVGHGCSAAVCTCIAFQGLFYCTWNG